jgi:hypothetical protein
LKNVFAFLYSSLFLACMWWKHEYMPHISSQYYDFIVFLQIDTVVNIHHGGGISILASLWYWWRNRIRHSFLKYNWPLKSLCLWTLRIIQVVYIDLHNDSVCHDITESTGSFKYLYNWLSWCCLQRQDILTWKQQSSPWALLVFVCMLLWAYMTRQIFWLQKHRYAMTVALNTPVMNFCCPVLNQYWNYAYR